MIRTLFLVAAITIAGCARYDVQVLDAGGRPVEGVQATAVALTVSGPVVETNAAGWARVERSPLQKPYWLRVRPPGGEWHDLRWPADWPVRFILHEGALWPIPAD